MTTEELIEQFRVAVQNHDVTYDYSDDHQVWRRGGAQLAEINRLAALIPRETAVKIWNERMDKYFVASEAPRWYWKV